MTETQTILKPQNLRVGNWVNTSVEPSLTIDHHKVKEISGDFCYCDGVGSCEWDDITPIPLTPEILEKAGFDDKGFLELGGDLEGQTISYHKLGIAYLFGQDAATNRQAFALRCEYLHQLQNLYHSLTGTELEITL